MPSSVTEEEEGSHPQEDPGPNPPGRWEELWVFWDRPFFFRGKCNSKEWPPGEAQTLQMVTPESSLESQRAGKVSPNQWPL